MDMDKRMEKCTWAVAISQPTISTPIPDLAPPDPPLDADSIIVDRPCLVAGPGYDASHRGLQRRRPRPEVMAEEPGGVVTEGHVGTFGEIWGKMQVLCCFGQLQSSGA